MSGNVLKMCTRSNSDDDDSSYGFDMPRKPETMQYHNRNDLQGDLNKFVKYVMSVLDEFEHNVNVVPTVPVQKKPGKDKEVRKATAKKLSEGTEALTQNLLTYLQTVIEKANDRPPASVSEHPKRPNNEDGKKEKPKPTDSMGVKGTSVGGRVSPAKIHQPRSNVESGTSSVKDGFSGQKLKDSNEDKTAGAEVIPGETDKSIAALRKQELDENRKEIKDREDEIRGLKDKIKEDRAKYNELDRTFKTDKAKMEDEIKTLKDEIKTLKDEIKTLKEDNEKRSESIQDQEVEHVKKMQALRGELEDRKRELKDKKHDYHRLEKDLSSRESEIERLEKQVKTQTRENLKLGEEKERKEAEVKDLIGRLGQLASDKMQQDNPDVADLGDPNRALKLADRYDDLYNTHWTKAFRAQRKEKLSEKRNDRDFVIDLLGVLQMSFYHCEEIARAQELKLKHLLQHPVQDVGHDQPAKSVHGLRSEQDFKLKEIRKGLSIGAVEEVKSAFWAKTQHNLSRIEDENEKGDTTKLTNISKDYCMRCVELCWAMVLHNPPLYMRFEVKPGEPVNRDWYNMRSPGDSVDILVWPPLFLGNEERFLAKGCVEGQRKISK